ncbi:MAG: hypothetical protein V4584_00340 [Verrucomicrobiota bacterium]
MRLSQLTCIVWCANSLLDEGGDSPFTVAELEKEGRAGRLVELILRMDDEGGTIAFAVQTEESKRWMESVLGDAFSALDGRFSRKAGVGRNPLCLVVAIAVEAIQQQFAGAKATR